jgi:hypothetical protein
MVYYMRIGNRVKIGWSTNVEKRRAAINPEEVMAVERGGYALEQQRHDEFASLRTHGEWFRLEEPLTSHIEALRAAARAEPLPEPEQAHPAMDATEAENLVYRDEAARRAGVAMGTVVQWERRGILPVAARDGMRPMYRLVDVAKAEYFTRKNSGRKYHMRKYPPPEAC